MASLQPDPPNWTLRDHAIDLVQQRQALAASAGDGGTSSLANLTVSRSFDTRLGTLRQKIQQDNWIVQRAFDLAAGTVLEALRSRTCSQSMHSDRRIDNVMMDLEHLDGIPDLPMELRDHERLLQLRHASLQRAVHNKEHVREASSSNSKKSADGGADIILGPAVQRAASSSATMTTVATNKTANKKRFSVSGSVLVVPPSVADIPERSAQGEVTLATKSAAGVVKSAASPGRKSKDSTIGSGPKFSRNTPASSAAALDARFKSARAILCMAGNVVFRQVTPPFGRAASDDDEVDALTTTSSPDDMHIPQISENKDSAPEVGAGITSKASPAKLNMNAVATEASTLATRTLSLVRMATKRSQLRYQYRRDNARDLRGDDPYYRAHQHLLAGSPSPPAVMAASSAESSSDDHDNEDATNLPQNDDGRAIKNAYRYPPALTHAPNVEATQGTHWTDESLPRFLRILEHGAGHVLYHDVQWCTRHARIADVLRSLVHVRKTTGAWKDEHGSFGPHLIITGTPDVITFAQEFHDTLHWGPYDEMTNPDGQLRVVAYHGSRRHRQTLRQNYFTDADGLPESATHVVVASYTCFLQDYLHFCQLPWDAVVVDDGASWLALASVDSNALLGQLWTEGMFSSRDHGVGTAGTTLKDWDFSVDDFPETVMKNAWIGLTARRRILTASVTKIRAKQAFETLPVPGLIDFLAPTFAEVVREEWERSRIASDAASMTHFRKLISRSVVVHDENGNGKMEMQQWALAALNGDSTADRGAETVVPVVVPDLDLVCDGKLTNTKRHYMQWFGPEKTSWIRHELSRMKLGHIVGYMKASERHGFFCEEVTTASSTTTSGAFGQVAGTMAFRCAMRCGRHFGSEQALRLHISALHAPLGTWLCRTCGSDCVTSQARTHHERSCGQPVAGGNIDVSLNVGSVPSVGQGNAKKGPGKKKTKVVGQAKNQSTNDEKEPDGSAKVRGYRGVWVDKAGKHFVKVHGKRLTKAEGSEDTMMFETSDDAARKYDDVAPKMAKKNQMIELNFNPDTGTRVIYDDPTVTSGVGSSAASVVPALSVINIKDLPEHVKPLLRDPRMTSRTGGNSKRHVYAYRGVCRQARKGHDRWQSQISFMGVNHYLGTFDSEWDAAAIYAWAHLILYGEEATKQAQKEGEEAAAAYEQERKDIEAGKIPEQPPKPEKKKPGKKKEKSPEAVKSSNDTPERKRKPGPKPGGAEKKAKPGPKPGLQKTGEARALAPILSRAVQKAPILAGRTLYEGVDDVDLHSLAKSRIVAARNCSYGSSFEPSGASPELRACCPWVLTSPRPPVGYAMLLGLKPASFGWDLAEFIENNNLAAAADSMTAIQMLAVEYDEDGTNETFRTVLQGTVCLIGAATEAVQTQYMAMGLGTTPSGGTVGTLDCHIGGVPGSCSAAAALIRATARGFEMLAVGENDIVSVNGDRIEPSSEPRLLQHEDLCQIGPRVFVFLLPMPGICP